ncbi:MULTISPECIES: TetR/AcrR family transcriptional regulator [unclassified Arthrobacter]|uniref:TetR/AcrR family transcriptional regulator n=1 Tax=unclassified Arthrobacter TaxID=235627 RepID=UPI002DFEDF98|nr:MULTISPECIES: helix-turn-helix domain-containing protein [unclassified Arthrobacter]MEC5189996.1 AcrR family transcriptional regulator [Arthrobacter sp. MP_M4]MEC5201464.1 AcrR family transcriptional regulator [Arthrobacter sp. MP_M7]
MSRPYVDNGRTGQKRRTLDALVAAARQLVAAGSTPTVDDAALAAGVSRSTAYRYFPGQRELLAAAHPETARRSMLPDVPPEGVSDRLDAVVVEFTRMILETEAQQRTMLRLSLEPAGNNQQSLPLRQGRAIGWITEALSPLRSQLPDQEIHRLVLAIRSVIGIEALVWLTDVGGLSREAAVASMRWTAGALLNQALSAGLPGADFDPVRDGPVPM